MKFNKIFKSREDMTEHRDDPYLDNMGPFGGSDDIPAEIWGDLTLEDFKDVGKWVTQMTKDMEAPLRVGKTSQRQV